MPKIFSYPFTRDLTPARRRTLERRFVNSDTRCAFLPRNTYQIVPLKRCNVSIPCVWPLISGNVTACRKIKTLLMGTVARIFDVRVMTLMTHIPRWRDDETHLGTVLCLDTSASMGFNTNEAINLLKGCCTPVPEGIGGECEKGYIHTYNFI